MDFGNPEQSSRREAQSKEEYDQLVQSYYLARAQHQTEMLRLNQVLYGSRDPPTGSRDHPTQYSRPVLQGISDNMIIDSQHPPGFSDTARKRIHAGHSDEDGERENLRKRSKNYK